MRTSERKKGTNEQRNEVQPQKQQTQVRSEKNHYHDRLDTGQNKANRRMTGDKRNDRRNARKDANGRALRARNLLLTILMLTLGALLRCLRRVHGPIERREAAPAPPTVPADAPTPVVAASRAQQLREDICP